MVEDHLLTHVVENLPSEYGTVPEIFAETYVKHS